MFYEIICRRCGLGCGHWHPTLDSARSCPAALEKVPPGHRLAISDRSTGHEVESLGPEQFLGGDRPGVVRALDDATRDNPRSAPKHIGALDIRPKVISLFDLSGHWSRPWAEDGRFDVLLFDTQRDPAQDINLIRAEDYSGVAVVLAAPPCKLLTKTAARWRSRYTERERKAAIALIQRTLDLIAAWQPAVWAIENPPGLTSRFFAGRDVTKMVFHPYEYAGWLRPDDPSLQVHKQDLRDRYSKVTGIWGDFTIPEKRPLPRLDQWGRHTAISWVPPGPHRVCIRSRTPMGFARAFYEANVGSALHHSRQKTSHTAQ